MPMYGDVHKNKGKLKFNWKKIQHTNHVINFLCIDLIKLSLVPHISRVVMFVKPLLDQILPVQPLSLLTRVLGICLTLMQKFSAPSAEYHFYTITIWKIN